jgi:hypothetical protein
LDTPVKTADTTAEAQKKPELLRKLRDKSTLIGISNQAIGAKEKVYSKVPTEQIDGIEKALDLQAYC